MTARARQAADYGAANAPYNVLTQYDDGCIAYLSLSAETAERITEGLREWRKELGKDGTHLGEIEPGQSADGLMWAWVIPGAHEVGLGFALSELLEGFEFGSRDQRQSDDHLIGHFFALLDRASA